MPTLSMLWSKEEAPRATAAGRVCFSHEMRRAFEDLFSFWRHIIHWGFVYTLI